MESNNSLESLSADCGSCGESRGQETLGQETLGQGAFDYEILRDEVPSERCTDLQADQVEAEPVECGGMQAADESGAAPEQAREREADEGDDAGTVRAAHPFALLVAPDAAQAAAKNLAGQKHARHRHSMDTKPVKPLRGELAEYDAAIDREEEEPEGQWGGSAGSARSAAGMVAGLLGH